MTTKATDTRASFVAGTSRGQRNAATFALQMAREAQQLLEMADRVRKLRGARPQPVIADAVSVRLRSYQHWEEGDGGISWPSLQRLARFHGVSENYILYGAEKPSAPKSQLERIEDKIDRLLAHFPDESLIAGIFETPAAPDDAQDGQAARKAASAGGRKAQAAPKRRAKPR